MRELFSAIEEWPFSAWAREDPYAYFIALIFHAIGMALLVGGGLVINLRVLGVASSAPLQRVRGFIPVMWVGAATATVSGAVLLAGYPAKALTNPVFAIKFACLLGAVMLLPTREHSRIRAALSLALWLGAVAAGKLLLHTYTILMVH